MAVKPNWFNRLCDEHSLPWKYTFSAASWRWERLHHLPLSIIDCVSFHVLYTLEAVVLVAACCCFFCCCGCHL